MKKKLIILKKRIKETGLYHTIGFAISSAFYKAWVTVYSFIYLKRAPVDKEKFVFSSNPDFSDNAKALFLYLQHKLPDHKYVWLVKNNIPDEEKGKYGNTEFVQIGSKRHHGASVKAMKEICTARYVFFTHGSPMRYVSRKPGQIVINLWHGCGYKEIQKDGKPYVCTNPFDYALVPGRVFIDTKQKFWGCKREQILPLGYPRYDFMLQESEKAKEFSEFIRQEPDNKVIIWMPTFRNTGTGLYPEEKKLADYDLPLLESDDQLNQLNLYCKESSVVLCIKRHPYQMKYSGESGTYSNIRFVSGEDFKNKDVELYSFLRYTDALITDYSSIAIDYILLNKPIAFSLDDYADYKNTRGFVFENPLNYMPGNHMYDFNDLKGFIADIASGEDKYKTEREALIPEVHNPCKGYSDRLWREISTY